MESAFGAVPARDGLLVHGPAGGVPAPAAAAHRARLPGLRLAVRLVETHQVASATSAVLQGESRYACAFMQWRWEEECKHYLFNVSRYIQSGYSLSHLKQYFRANGQGGNVAPVSWTQKLVTNEEIYLQHQICARSRVPRKPQHALVFVLDRQKFSVPPFS